MIKIMIKIILLELKRYAKLFIFVIKQLILYVKTYKGFYLENLIRFLKKYKKIYIRRLMPYIIITVGSLMIYALWTSINKAVF